MIVTLAYLRRQFDEFNRLVFDSRLPTPRLRISNSRSMLGCVRYKIDRRILRKPLYKDFTLSISVYYDLAEDVLDDTILHEMIHLDILSNHMRDDSAHGPLFRKIMNEINRRFGRHITISHRGQLTKAPKLRSAQNIIAVSQLENGDWGVTRASLTRVIQLRQSLPLCFRLRSIKWYNTSNPFFENYPRSLTPKIYKIDRCVLERELAGALEIFREK